MQATTLVQLRPGFMPDPHTMTGTAGGTIRANTFDPTCNGGNIPTAPQHTMTLADDFQNLKIMVNSSRDTTLVIRDPQGGYRCNDDGTNEGLNPAIEGAFAAGTYQVWVGTFSVGSTPRYTIGFTEITTIMSTSLALP